MPTINASLQIPDSKLAKEATEILRTYATSLIYNHSLRVYLFAAEQGREKNYASILNCFTSAPHSTISDSSRSSPALTNASKWMERMQRGASWPRMVFQRSRCRRPGRRLRCTPRRA